MKYLVDTHTHTIASGHAYNTIDEMTRKASEMGLSYLAVTEHAPKMWGSCTLLYFSNLGVVPRYKYNVKRYMGCEANICDYKGKLDLPRKILSELDIVIASLHIPCIEPGSLEENTNAIIGAIENPYVNIIGHPDDSRYPVDYERIVKAAKENHTLLELNNNSLNPNGPRQGTRENDIIMLKLCKEHNVCISLGSDAHIEEDICNFGNCEVLLKELDFPDSLIVNTDIGLFESYLHKNLIK